MSIIEALRCAATPLTEKQDCSKCKWHAVEWCDEHPEIPIPADCEIDGRKAWVSCDCDRIANEAANLIEELTGRDTIDRAEALNNLCWFCEHKCEAEKHKGVDGYGLRCAQWLAMNSMEGATDVKQ